MPQQPVTYEIDDAKSVDQNLSTFEGALDSADAPLAVVLVPCLSTMSLEQQVDYPSLLDALYGATAEKNEDEANPSSEGSCGQAGMPS